MIINWIDISIILIILLNIIIGMRKGIIRGIINVIGIVMAIFLAIFWFQEVGGYITLYIQVSREIANIIGFILIFLVVYTLAKITELILKKIFSLLFVSWIDHLGGALFGLVKGSLIVGILLIILSFIPLPVFLKEQLKNSFFANRFAVMTTVIYDYLKDWLPSSLQFNTEEFLKKYHLNLFVL
jgi:membrane protein required for colicin V production